MNKKLLSITAIPDEIYDPKGRRWKDLYAEKKAELSDRNLDLYSANREVEELQAALERVRGIEPVDGIYTTYPLGTPVISHEQLLAAIKGEKS